MVKGKTIKKTKKVSKQKVSLPKKVKKGQITKKELKSVGFITPDNKLKSSAPVESISGIGVKKGAVLRAQKPSIETVGDYKKNFRDFILEKRAKKPKPKPIKPKPKPIIPKKPKPKPTKPKPKPKRKYYVIDKKTGIAISTAIDSKAEAKEKEKLFKAETTVVYSKPENLERMGVAIKKRYEEVEVKYKKEDFKVARIQEDTRYGQTLVYAKVTNKKTGVEIQDWFKPIQLRYPHTQLEFINWEKEEKPKPKPVEVVSEAPFLDKQVLEIEDLVKANDYQKSKEFVSKESDFDNVTRLLDTKQTHLDSIERDMSALKDTEANRKALARLNRVQKLTKDSIAEWESEKEKFLSEKVEAPRKGNDYINQELSEEWITKPNLKDWLNEKGKVRKKDLRKHVIAVYEAEYGKGSSEVKTIREGTKYATGKQLHKILQSWMKTSAKEKDNKVIFRHD